MSLVVVTGPPGAGKSTVARLVADSFEPSVLVEGDAFFGFLARGAVEPWLPGSHDQNEVVTRAAASAAGHFAANGYTTVYDGVVWPWRLPNFAAEAGLERLSYAVLLPPMECCVERVATRRGHGFVDEAATRDMHRQFREAELPERHIFRDPPEEPSEAAGLVLSALARGELECAGSER